MMTTGLEPARAGGIGETRGRGGPTWGHVGAGGYSSWRAGQRGLHRSLGLASSSSRAASKEKEAVGGFDDGECRR
jgi:hypothetical protein